MLKGLGRNAAVYGGADLAFKLIQFAVLPVYARLLSVEDFGLMALLAVSATLLGVVANLGVSFAIVRFYFDAGIAPERRPFVVSTGLAQLLVFGGAFVAVVSLLLFQWRVQISDSYGLPWTLVLIVLLTILPDQVAQYALDTSRLQFAPWRFFAIAMLKNVAGLLIGLWLLIGRDMGLTGLFAGNLVAAAAAAPIGLWLIRRDLIFAFDPAYFRQILRFGVPFVFTAAAYWVFGSMDRWMLIELSDAVQVGLFSVALKFASVLTLLIGAFHQGWIPAAMRMAGEQPDYRIAFGKVFSGWYLLLALSALAVALFAPEAMALLTPREYWAAAPALAIGVAAVAVSGTTQLTMLGLMLEKRTALMAAAAWAAAAANVALNFLLIPRYGAVGAAVATLLSYSLLSLLSLRWSQKVHPIPLAVPKLLYCSALVAAAAAAPLLHPIGGPGGLALKAGLLALAGIGAFAAGIVERSLYGQLRLLAGR